MIDEIIAKTNAKRSGSGYSGHCPAHDDKNPSLSFWEDGGIVRFKCHAGCSTEEIKDALGIPSVSKGSSGNSYKQIALQAIPIHPTGHNPASKYLKNRGITLDHFPTSLGYVANLEYWEDKKLRGEFPGERGEMCTKMLVWSQ